MSFFRDIMWGSVGGLSLSFLSASLLFLAIQGLLNVQCTMYMALGDGQFNTNKNI